MQPFTIEGFRESNPTAVAITVTDHLLVKPNDAYTTPKEPTPTRRSNSDPDQRHCTPGEHPGGKRH